MVASELSIEAFHGRSVGRCERGGRGLLNQMSVANNLGRMSISVWHLSDILRLLWLRAAL